MSPGETIAGAIPAVAQLPGDPIARGVAGMVGIGFIVALAAVSVLIWWLSIRLKTMEKHDEDHGKTLREIAASLKKIADRDSA